MNDPKHQAPKVVYPVEPKVKSSAATSGGAALLITPALVRLIDDVFYGGGEVDLPVEYIGLIGGAVALLASLAGGYLARHVERIPLRP